VRATIETSRLILRPFESSDVEAAFAWFGDPIVMRFTPTGPDTSLDQTKARLTSYQEHQTTHGFSKWIILDRRLGCAIGDSGLLELREYACIDLGFRLVQRYWGKGLATEAASAWVHAAFLSTGGLGHDRRTQRPRRLAVCSCAQDFLSIIDEERQIRSGVLESEMEVGKD